MAGAMSFLDDFVEGATKGLKSTKQIKASVNKVASNMTDQAKIAARNQKIAKGLNLQPSMKTAVRTARQTTGDNTIQRVGGIRLGGNSAGNFNRSKVVTGKNVRNITVNTAGANNTFAAQTGDFFGGGIRETVKGYKNNGGDLWGAFKKAHTKLDANGKEVIDLKRAAGTYMTASIAGRVVTGGGLYKDRNGNTNLPGIPFL